MPAVSATRLFGSLTETMLNGKVDWVGHEIRVALLSPSVTVLPEWTSYSDLAGETVGGRGYTAGGQVLPDRSARRVEAGSWPLWEPQHRYGQGDVVRALSGVDVLSIVKAAGFKLTPTVKISYS